VGKRLEALAGDRKGQHSIRVNPTRDEGRQAAMKTRD
jgi:hypothetical protein